MNNEFLRSGNKILTRPAGMDCELEIGEVYTLKWDDWNGLAYLELGSTMSLPINLFKTKSDEKFIQKVINSFNKEKKPTTGVMLTGLKGSGKTVMSKMLAFESNLPIIIIDPTFPTRHLDKFFSKFTQTKVCVIFDEIDKNERFWNTENLLSFLDGIQSTSKKLVLFTCNNDSKVNEFVLDRCSRIRYCKTFDKLPKEAILEIANQTLTDTSKANEIAEFVIDRFQIVSYDNVVSFMEEVNAYPEDDLISLVDDLNITLKKKQ